MIGSETLILKCAKSIVNNLAKWGYKNVVQYKDDEYTQELYEIISKAIERYQVDFPVEETEQIPFYKSETLLQAFLQFRFSKELNLHEVKAAVDADKRIIPPSSEEINRFYEYVQQEIDQSKTIKSLNISINYKEEVFNISSKLNELRDALQETISIMKREIASSNLEVIMVEEWNKQLDEIAENLHSFKAKTALKRLEYLEQRINEQSITSNTLFAKLYSLQADALGLIYGIDSSGEKDRQAKLFVRIYNLNQNNQDYKSNAAMAYLTLGEPAKAIQLANELLARDEFNLVGWLIKCFIADQDYMKVIVDIPASLRKTNVFKVNIFRYLNSKGYIKSIKELEDLGVDLTLQMETSIKVSYINVHFLHLASVYLMDIYYSKNLSIRPFLQYPNAKGDSEFKYSYKLLEICTEKLKGTEVEEAYLYYKFLYHSNKYVLEEDKQDIVEMEKVFAQLGAYPPADAIVRMMQAYNSYPFRILRKVDGNSGSISHK